MPTIQHAAISHPAAVFSQDRRWESPETKTFAVFDGMSGKPDGDAAADIACTHLSHILRNIAALLTPEHALVLLSTALRQTSAHVHEERQRRGNEMSTTASVCHLWLHDGFSPHAIIGNVGDSRVYILRRKSTLEMTLDHGVLSEYCRNKTEAEQLQQKFGRIAKDDELSAAEYALFNLREWMTQTIGDQHVNPVMHITPVLAGDRILLCSDGVHDNLTNPELQAILAETTTPTSTCERILAAARSRMTDGSFRSKQDDATAIVVDILP